MSEAVLCPGPPRTWGLSGTFRRPGPAVLRPRHSGCASASQAQLPAARPVPARTATPGTRKGRCPCLPGVGVHELLDLAGPAPRAPASSCRQLEPPHRQACNAGRHGCRRPGRERRPVRLGRRPVPGGAPHMQPGPRTGGWEHSTAQCTSSPGDERPRADGVRGARAGTDARASVAAGTRGPAGSRAVAPEHRRVCPGPRQSL